MTFLIDASARYETRPTGAPVTSGERSTSYQIVSAFPLGAEVAAAQLLRSELFSLGAARIDETEVSGLAAQ